MMRDQMSLPQPKQKDPPGALAVQNQDQEEEEDCIIQIAKHAKEEWETFHLEHPDIDEEIFIEAQRFCLKQWFLHHGITLADLPAFEEAETHFACEVQERVAEIEAIAAMMDNPIYWEALSLGVLIATQAQERSKRVREAIKELSSKTAPYLAGKINTLRAPEQAQQREQEAQERLEEVSEAVDYLESLGIAREYENQKVALREREQGLREHMSTLGHLLAESQHNIDATRYIAKLEEYIRLFDILLEDLHPKTVDTYHARDAVGTVSSDGNAARKRVKHVRAQAETLQDFISAIQEGVKDTLTKAQAVIQHKRLVKHTLERMRKRRTEIEQWAQEAKQQAEERKKKIE